MIIGCFALIEPFKTIDQQFQLIKDMGIDYADLTDNHNGGMLGVEYGFTASISLDCHPEKIRRMAENAGITLTSVCAHANLLDPPAPDVYSTNEIIKAVRLAHLLGIKQVITTEGDPKTQYGHNLTFQEKIFTICQKLYTPVQWAAELGIELLIEPHGCVTDSIEGMETILNTLNAPDTVGICLDTGNSWLGGSEPIEYIRKFGKLIQHVHFKDLGKEWESKRGTLFGCGMAGIPLGDGVIGIKNIVKALMEIGFNGPTTLEIAGADNVRISAERLGEWSKL
ncbi:MAG: sugar phosphate isomerase/epimerase family protein [Planctomycetota bacterium]|jgi:inosose dehydratase